MGSKPSVGCVYPELTYILEGPRRAFVNALDAQTREVSENLSGGDIAALLWNFVQEDGAGLEDGPDISDGIGASREGSSGDVEAKRYTIMNRFSLVVMAGVAAENVVTGFDLVSASFR